MYTCIYMYTCIKSVNGLSDERSQLDVIWSPRLTTNKELPQIIISPTARTVRLECDVDARPKASIKWFRNGKEVETGGRITIRKSSNLVISQTVTSDSGHYTCLASNDVANVSFPIANLTIQASDDRPQKPKGVQFVSVSSNSVEVTWKPVPVTNEDLPILSYSVHFTPDSTASGAKEEQKIAMTNTVVVDKLTPSTNYSFYIRAYNMKGASEPSKTYRVQTSSTDPQQETSTTSVPVQGRPIPTIPTTPVWFPVTIEGFTPESPTSVVVTWQKLPASVTNNHDRTPISGNPGLKVTSFEVHYRKHSQQNYQYLTVEDTNANSALVEGLQPGVKYDVRVIATLSSAPIDPSTPNQRPPSNSMSLGRWSFHEMPSRDSSSSSSTITTNLPPPDLKGNNSTNKPFNVSAITETDYSNSSINVSARNDPSSLTTQVPDSSSTNDYNNNSNDNDKNNNSTPKFLNEDEQDSLILGMVLDKFIVWSTITLVIFASAIAACLLICCCRKG